MSARMVRRLFVRRPFVLASASGVFLVAAVFLVVVAAGLQARHARSAQSPPRESAALSPLDYVEIQQLAARYAYAVDSGAGNGEVYASLFAPDGAFVDRMGREIRGREPLIALARRNTRGEQSAFHFVVNHIIEPSPDGAVGRQFLLQVRIGDGDRPNEIFGGGHYQDEYVRTADGWRFRRRQFIPSEGTPATLRGGAR